MFRATSRLAAMATLAFSILGLIACQDAGVPTASKASDRMSDSAIAVPAGSSMARLVGSWGYAGGVWNPNSIWCGYTPNRGRGIQVEGLAVTPSMATGSEQVVQEDVTLWVYYGGWQKVKTKSASAVTMSPLMSIIGVDYRTTLPTLSFDVEVVKGWSYAITTELTWRAQSMSDGFWMPIGTKSVSFSDPGDYSTFGGARTGVGGYCTMTI